MEKAGEGAYGYSVVRGGSVGHAGGARLAGGYAGAAPCARLAGGSVGVAGGGRVASVGGNARLQGDAVMRGGSARVTRQQCSEGCPMCYHNLKNPCASCGCPSVGQAKQRPALPTPEFFSPSSDYYSLSPSSPPSSPPSISPDPSGDLPQPIYAKVNKHKVTQSSEKEDIQESREVKEEEEEEKENKGESIVNKSSKKEKSEPRKTSLPLYPERSQERKRPGLIPGEPRRHSWAAPVPRQTSLQEFKRLLAAQTPGQNPHRVSAKELLDKEREEGGGLVRGEDAGQGSIRRRGQQWKDQRFSVIQEEEPEEGRSRESLLSSRR